MSASKPTGQVLTANRLRDGAVVYLGADGDWDTRFERLRIAADKVEAAALEAVGARAAADQIVVAPYLIDVAEEGGRIVPTRYRERIRALGPSTHPELAKQAFAS
jgi:hypothetical protein